MGMAKILGHHLMPEANINQSPGMPCQTHGQSVFKQERWHQGQSPGAWGGLSQLNSAFLEYSSYHEEARSRPETTANWSGVYGEQLPQKEWGHHNAGDPDQGNNLPANTGGGQYETSHSRYGKWQDNRGEDTRQTPAHTYGDRQDNRDEDTRQTPTRTYGDPRQ
ncbi:unnamed protein product [Mytilus coruscus]|uniref:Uncharacterized protein n=1 Tax=Mytilus coruscus TaxID=42192 RepID=A0A6J8BAI1_MYTCO|nr:unnamed protein product [Mytilus coruscus]